MGKTSKNDEIFVFLKIGERFGMTENKNKCYLFCSIIVNINKISINNIKDETMQ